jgi:uncharacterized protein (DUF2141 family)
MEMGMKKIFAVMVFVLLITACTPKPEIIDNGNPGQIKVSVFLDENRNGVKDPGEPGVVDQVGLSHDKSCPAIDKETIVETNTSGETIFDDLPPGIYCVAFLGDKGVTTKLNADVYLSSEQVAQVAFGLVAD